MTEVGHIAAFNVAVFSLQTEAQGYCLAYANSYARLGSPCDFAQVCKQTTSNPDANSDLRGWQLLLSLLAVATPSKHLAPCFKKHCEQGPVGSIPQTYAQYALSALQKVGASSPYRSKD